MRRRQVRTHSTNCAGGKDPMVLEESDKPTVIALREIAEGFVTNEILRRESEMDAEDELADVMEANEAL